MRLCDQCIAGLATELSDEAQQTVKKIFPLFEEEDQLNKRDISRVVRLNRNNLDYVLHELESNLILTSEKYRRNQIYELTETGQRLLNLKNNNLDSDEKETQEIQAKEEVDSSEEVTSQDISNNNEEQDNNEEVEDNQVESSVVEDDAPAETEQKKSEPITWDMF